MLERNHWLWSFRMTHTSMRIPHTFVYMQHFMALWCLSHTTRARANPLGFTIANPKIWKGVRQYEPTRGFPSIKTRSAELFWDLQLCSSALLFLNTTPDPSIPISKYTNYASYLYILSQPCGQKTRISKRTPGQYTVSNLTWAVFNNQRHMQNIIKV